MVKLWPDSDPRPWRVVSVPTFPAVIVPRVAVPEDDDDEEGAVRSLCWDSVRKTSSADPGV